MPRIDKVNEEIRHCLASLLASVKDPRVRGVVSIVHVDTTPDFKQARVYISVLNDTDTQEVLKGPSGQPRVFSAANLAAISVCAIHPS